MMETYTRHTVLKVKAYIYPSFTQLWVEVVFCGYKSLQTEDFYYTRQFLTQYIK